MRKSSRPVAPRRVISPNRGTRSRAEAAIELVRLEYERERLTQSANELTNRLEGVQGGLSAVNQRIRWLTGIINTDPDAHPAAQRRPGPTKLRGVQ